MRIRADDEDLNTLIGDAPIPQAIALRIIQDHEGLLLEEVDYANRLLDGAGTFAGPWAVRKFIRAELSTAEVSAECERKRALIARLTKLFPAIVRVLETKDIQLARIAFCKTYDTCSDYPFTLAQGRRDKNLKNKLQKMKRLQAKVAELNALIGDVEASEPYDFEVAHRTYLKRVHPEDDEARPFWKLERDLQIFQWHLELSVFRAAKDPDKVRVPNNQAKTSIVETAYDFSLSAGSPPFVTTPGSEFSYLCSLLFEVASGGSDEGLSGAISRFARSRERKEADQYRVDFSEERDRARDEDNFYDLKDTSDGFDHAAELASELRDATISKEARVLVMCELESLVDGLEDRQRIHRPFLMWAHQMKVDWQGQLNEMEERSIAEFHRDTKFGEEQRAKRSD